MQSETQDCPECGEPFEAYARYCDHCGAKRLVVDEPEEPIASQRYRSEFQSDRSESRVFGVLALILIVGIIMAVITIDDSVTGPDRQIRSEPERLEPLTEQFKTVACRAVVALLNGRSPSSVEAQRLNEDLFHVTHTRPEDNTVWQTRCQHQSRGSLMWAAYDQYGDGSGQGRWRTEDTIEFEINADQIHVTITTMGQDIQRWTYNLSEFE